ncbi:MAG: YigZ family protein [Tenericutes bacterium HGW-Tenericutes-5]|nr:MAG: YigZ family protein [Tenericutes bacterium HGW-Tenericutes-5]
MFINQCFHVIILAGEYMKSVDGFTKTEFIEKKSRFIGLLYHVETVEEITRVLEKARTDYPGANHYTYAYILEDNLAKYSDDGEPNRTAGYPILEVVKANELNHVLLIVIRYFGGILLGGGGLIRAYSHTAAQVISEAVFTKKITTYYCKVTCSYDYLGNIDKTIREQTLLDKIDYGNEIEFYFSLTELNFEEIKQRLFNFNNYQDRLVIIEEKHVYVKVDC